ADWIGTNLLLAAAVLGLHHLHFAHGGVLDHGPFAGVGAGPAIDDDVACHRAAHHGVGHGAFQCHGIAGGIEIAFEVHGVGSHGIHPDGDVLLPDLVLASHAVDAEGLAHGFGFNFSEEPEVAEHDDGLHALALHWFGSAHEVRHLHVPGADTIVQILDVGHCGFDLLLEGGHGGFRVELLASGGHRRCTFLVLVCGAI